MSAFRFRRRAIYAVGTDDRSNGSREFRLWDLVAVLLPKADTKAANDVPEVWTTALPEKRRYMIITGLIATIDDEPIFGDQAYAEGMWWSIVGTWRIAPDDGAVINGVPTSAPPVLVKVWLVR